MASPELAIPRITVPTRLWLIMLAGCILAGVLDAFQMAMQGLIGGDGIRWQSVVFQGSEWLFLGALTPITYYLGQRFPVRRPRIGRSLAIHALGALVLCIGWASLGVALRHALGDGWDMPWQQELVSWMLISLPWSYIMYFFLLGTVHAFTYYMEARERRLQTVQLSGQLSEARLQALRSQLQPHFLFNTLNAVTVLVRDRRDALAVRMLDLLSDMLRTVLRPDQPHEIPLRAELQLTQQYLAIEQVRFSDRLTVEFRVAEETQNALVPSLVLQPLVENAIRHGLAEQLDDARIEIGARRDGDMLELWVRDNGRGMAQQPARGVGLENTRERLTTLYGERATLTLRDDPQGGTIARIRLPWREATS